MEILGSVDEKSWFGIFLSVASPIFAMFIFLSPISTMRKIYRHKSTLEFSYIPFMFMTIASSIWFTYAYFTRDVPIIVPNALGFLLSVCYSVFFIYYAEHRKQLRVLVFPYLCAAILVLTLSVVDMGSNDKKVEIIGIVATIIHLLFMASPFAVIKKVIETKSVECMPLGLSLACFINAVSWTLYGVLVIAEIPVIISNAVAAILTFFQLLCHVVYGDFLHCFCPKTSSEDEEKEVHKDEEKIQIEESIVLG